MIFVGWSVVCVCGISWMTLRLKLEILIFSGYCKTIVKFIAILLNSMDRIQIVSKNTFINVLINIVLSQNSEQVITMKDWSR